MGYYIEGPNHGKAEYLVQQHRGVLVTRDEAAAVAAGGGEVAVIVVVNNGPFEAAAYIFNYEEWEAFHLPDETRSRAYVLMDRDKAEALSGYHLPFEIQDIPT